jgi:hypothetical protein
MPDLYPTISVPWIKSSMPPLGVFIFYLFLFIYLFTYVVKRRFAVVDFFISDISCVSSNI